MLIRFSNNPFRAALGVTTYNRKGIFLFAAIASIAYAQFMLFPWLQENEYIDDGWWMLPITIPMVPISILGGALAIFLGFRNNSAYDRWWEARKIWGGIVNYSRTFSVQVLSFASPFHSQEKVSDGRVKEWQTQMIHRHIAWLHGLKMHLRKEENWESLEKHLGKEEMDQLMTLSNKPSQLIRMQSEQLQAAYEEGIIEDFRHMEMARIQEEFYNLQGKCERIKNTVFPYYYNFFTRLFLWIFIVCLPFGLVEECGWWTIPLSIAISFIFYILDKAGNITEEPFEGRAADTPMSTIIRAIEIDLLEMLGAENVPPPMPKKIGRFGVLFQN